MRKFSGTTILNEEDFINGMLINKNKNGLLIIIIFI